MDPLRSAKPEQREKSYQSTLFEAPGNTFIPAYSATTAIPFRFVRLRYTLQSASVKALFGASIFTWTLS